MMCWSGEPFREAISLSSDQATMSAVTFNTWRAKRVARVRESGRAMSERASSVGRSVEVNTHRPTGSPGVQLEVLTFRRHSMADRFLSANEQSA
jgi:hypothetical protein